jgi:hypothetical protein
VPSLFDVRPGELAGTSDDLRIARSLAAPGLAVFVALGLLLYAGSDERGRLTVVALDATVLCVLAYIAAARLLPKFYAPRLLILSCGVQLLALTTIAMMGLPLSPPYHPFEANVSDAPFRVVSALLMVPAGTLLVALLWRLVSHLSPDRSERPISDQETRSQRRVYLVVAAIVHLLYWPSTLESSGALGYLGRVLAGALIAAPFIAGRDAREDRGLAHLWWLALLLNAIIGAAAGTRSKAFIPAVLFVAGFISGMPPRKRAVAGACALLAVLPLVQLAGAIALVRKELGRDMLNVTNPDRFAEVVRRLTEVMTSAEEAKAEETRVEGISRQLAWTNVVVPLMTPESVPYRGLDGLVDEALGTFRVARLSGSTADDLYDAGLYNAPARDYGFTVNSNTAVEFPLAADGWSRGGPGLLLLFAVITALAMITGEHAAARASRLSVGASTILVLPIAKAAFFDVNYIPLLPIIRGLFVYTFAVAVVIVSVELVRRLGLQGGRSRGALHHRRELVAVPDFANRRSTARS